MFGLAKAMALELINNLFFGRGGITLPETNSQTQHLKMDFCKTILSFWGPAYFQVRTVSFREGIWGIFVGIKNKKSGVRSLPSNPKKESTNPKSGIMLMKNEKLDPVPSNPPCASEPTVNGQNPEPKGVPLLRSPYYKFNF